MLQKESVNRRLESEDGISFTEFSYLLLQAHDFLQLFDRYGCTLQMGGSDQWGNITAGIDLIRKLRGEKAHGLVWPLMTTAGGTKFGKTEAGTVWLDPARTSPFRVLSVLAEHRRPRRRVVPEVLHVSRHGRDRSLGARDAVGAGKTRSAARARARGDGAACTARTKQRGAPGVELLFSANMRLRCRSRMCSRCSTTCRRPNVTLQQLQEERPIAQWLVETRVVPLEGAKRRGWFGAAGCT